MADSAPPHESLYATMMASALSGMLVRIPLHPIDTCKAKLQVQRPSSSASASSPLPFSNVLSCLRYTYQREGIRGLYAGFPIAFFGSAPAACLYLTSYELNKRWLSELPGTKELPQALQHFTAGLLAETFSCVLWVPIDIVKERMQVQSNIPTVQTSPTPPTSLPPSTPPASTPHPLHYRSTLHAISSIARTEGLRGIYRGYGATLASFGPYSAFYLSIYDQLKDLTARTLHTAPAALPFSAYLLCGAVSGGLAALITNPLDMAKLRLQVQRGGRGLDFGYRNLLHGMRCIVQEEGSKALWKGAGARIAFFAPSSALNIAIFDSLKAWFNQRMQQQQRSGQQQPPS